MQGHVKVSVILPVYNVADYVGRCIASLQAQTLQELEFIFVDDCSTDDSIRVIDEWASHDVRVRILQNVQNLGAGPSRNCGIEAARGEYLSFIDPDDYVAPDFYELLYAAAVANGGHDIAKGTQLRINADGSDSGVTRGPNEAIRSCRANGTPLYLCFTCEHQAAIYSRSLVHLRGIRYGCSIRAQDTTFLLRVCSYARSFCTVDEACYYFCARKDSAMHALDPSKLEGIALSLQEQASFVVNALPCDTHAIAYMQARLHGALREYERYDRLTDDASSIGIYLAALRDTMMQLPFCNELAERSYSLRVLRDYCIGLPARPYFSPWEGKNHPIRWAKLAIRWTGFFLAHPKEVLTAVFFWTRVL